MSGGPTPAPTGGRSFGAAAATYDAARPPYPRRAVEWALGTAPLRVLDLGAGTGLLTRTLVAAGHEVLAVEPDERMAAVLTSALPQARFEAGTAERLPLPDGTVDAVVCGQAFHWFDPSHALPEIHRVLRPGGVLAPMWNLRDERVDWVRELTRAIGPDRAHVRTDPGGSWPYGPVAPWFADPVATVVEHEVTTSPEGLVDLFRSRSYYLDAGPDERLQLEEALRTLVRTHPRLAGRTTFPLPYRTVVFRLGRT